ncbi:hypothetical protein [Nocardioides zeae]|uniref:Uncharacterized protein n=1 Tax=Nocardioides zeae TaxID=1457234 RepID=A0A6P0HF60_9ACTN|nr:hypothetical protein [Nocardioides zeae]NEN77359.1 hypothetical protein [Nocardioides zeae]
MTVVEHCTSSSKRSNRGRSSSEQPRAEHPLIDELQAAYRQAPAYPGLRRPLPDARRTRPEVRALWLAGGAVAATAVAIGVGYPLIGGSAGSGAPDDNDQVAASAEATSTSSSPPSSGATSTATDDDLGLVAEAVTGIVESDASGAEMADLVIDEDAGSVTVWLSGEPSSALVAELQEAAEAHGVALVIDSAEHSEAELMSIGAALWERNDEWSTRGFTIDGYWSTAAGLHIWTEGDVESAREALSSVPEIVEIEDGGGSDAGPGFVELPAPPPARWR